MMGEDNIIYQTQKRSRNKEDPCGEKHFKLRDMEELGSKEKLQTYSFNLTN